MAFRQIAYSRHVVANPKSLSRQQQPHSEVRKRTHGSDYAKSSKRIDDPNTPQDLNFNENYKSIQPIPSLKFDDTVNKDYRKDLLKENLLSRNSGFQLGNKNILNLVTSQDKEQKQVAKSDRRSIIDMKSQKLQNYQRHLKETCSTDSIEENTLNSNTNSTIKQGPSKRTVKKSCFQMHLQKRMEEHRKNMLLLRNFRVIQKIGEGKSGKVFKVIDRITGAIMAMKVINKNKIEKSNMLQQLIRELKIQSILNHPNIARLYGFFHDKQNLYILTELGCDGQLYSLIKDGKKVTQESASFITNSLLKALEYMHGLQILHRDVKPQNIVLVHGCVKLCDFGWAVSNDTDLRSTMCGTPLYLSPELISQRAYDQKVDIWAVGVLSFQLVTGTTPFNITNRSQLSKIVTSEVQFPKNCPLSNQFKSFAKEVLKKDPKKRLSCKEIRKLGFIKKHQDMEICEELCR